MGAGRLSDAGSLAARGSGKLGWLPSSNALSSSSHRITTAGLLHLLSKVSPPTASTQAAELLSQGLQWGRCPDPFFLQRRLGSDTPAGQGTETLKWQRVCCLLHERTASARAKSGVGLGLRNGSQRLSVLDMGGQMRANSANGTGKYKEI